MKPKFKILLVEDEPSLAMLIQENLAREGYDVFVENDGDSALKMFYEETPDLLILDVMMPKRNGFDVAKIIRNTDRKTPILFLSAKIKTADVVKGFKAGGNDYLRKPFAYEELSIRVKVLLNTERLVEPSHEEEKVLYELSSYTFDSRQCILFEETGKQTKITMRRI